MINESGCYVDHNPLASRSRPEREPMQISLTSMTERERKHQTVVFITWEVVHDFETDRSYHQYH